MLPMSQQHSRTAPHHGGGIGASVPANLWRPCVAGLLLSCRLLGQQPPAVLPPSPIPAVVELRREGHETESETIAKCLRDFAGVDVKLRRRAILILGKYTDPKAQQALIRALADEDAVVRQSALVSLSEKPATLISVRKPVVRLLGDSDVHIRRIASSQLRAVFGGGLRMVGMVPGRGRSGSVLQDQGEVALLNAALADEDATVRKNVLALHPYVGKFFEPAALEGCLRDGDREVRVIAVQAYAAATRAGKGGPTALAGLVRDPDAIVRREVVRALGAHGTQAAPMLLQLARDADPVVRCEAVKLLARIGDPKAFALLSGILADPAVAVDERRGLVRYMYRFPGQAEDVLLALAQSGPVTLRAEAVQVLGRLRDSTAPVTVFLRFANDESSSVRRAAMGVLQRRVKELTSDQVRGLMASDHVDVRRSALALLGVLPPEEGAELIIDGLLDEDVDIRRGAIQLVHTRRIPDWQQLLADSLLDENVEIRRAAADALLRTVDPASRRVVSEFLQNNEDPELATYMRMQLIRRRRPVRPSPNTIRRPSFPSSSQSLAPRATNSVPVSPSPAAAPTVRPSVPRPPRLPLRPRFPYQQRSKRRYRRPTYTPPRTRQSPATSPATKPEQTPQQ